MIIKIKNSIKFLIGIISIIMKNKHKIIIVIIILIAAAAFISSDWENVKAGFLGNPPVAEVQK